MEDGVGDQDPILAAAQGGQNEQNGEDDRAMRDYVMPRMDSNVSPIQLPTIVANNFEIKSHVFQMLTMMGQFGGLPSKDPNKHLRNFDQICSTFKINGATDNAIRLMIFHFSLKDQAKAWYDSLAPGSITTWDELSKVFLSKYFPPGKAAQLMNEIYEFSQFESKSLYKA
ncbi:hypothetical protein Ddye_018783 [Dipteronia dyeriana]|uniref:Retrotransposon gag domain-containing protein n=1 Tax=Dipteronia dyeriana TaxID=168575 RepID=A0AAD9UBS4_9ROSI|nr:hypothetical protein Ddye_018783 [Dipteronia dyeriana]